MDIFNTLSDTILHAFRRAIQERPNDPKAQKAVARIVYQAIDAHSKQLQKQLSNEIAATLSKGMADWTIKINCRFETEVEKAIKKSGVLENNNPF